MGRRRGRKRGRGRGDGRGSLVAAAAVVCVACGLLRLRSGSSLGLLALPRTAQSFVLVTPPTSRYATRSGSGINVLSSSPLPLPDDREIIRIELKGVPDSATSRFLKEWGARRVPLRSGELGAPRTSMPMTTELKLAEDPPRLLLQFDASPTDMLEISVHTLREGSSSALLMKRGEGGQAMGGSLGPQVKSLVRKSEQDVALKLRIDAEECAKRESMQSKARGISAPKQSYDYDSAPFGIAEGVIVDDVFGAYAGGKDSFQTEAVSMFEQVAAAQQKGENVVDFDREPIQFGVDMSDGFAGVLRSTNATEDSLGSLFAAGKDMAILNSPDSGQDQRALPASEELVQLEVMLSTEAGLQGGLDIFSGPPKSEASAEAMSAAAAEQEQLELGGVQRMYTMVDENDKPLLQLTAAEYEALNEDELDEQFSSLRTLLTEVRRAPIEMWPSILREYNDVLLHPYYILSMRAQVPYIETDLDRHVLLAINARATVLVQQLAMAKQAQEQAQLEKIRDICEAAMEDMRTLPDRVREMRPLLDADFVAYLRYAIDREKAASGAGDSLWLQVLTVIQKGVLAELAKDVKRDVDDIHLVLRMEEPHERRELLKLIIADLPTLSVRQFRKVAWNIVDGIALRDDVDADLKARVAELGTLLQELMPDSVVKEMSREADEWAEKRVQDSEALRKRAEMDVKLDDAAISAAMLNLRGLDDLDGLEGDEDSVEEDDDDLVDLSDLYGRSSNSDFYSSISEEEEIQEGEQWEAFSAQDLFEGGEEERLKSLRDAAAKE
jgi:hypothetical protein